MKNIELSDVFVVKVVSITQKAIQVPPKSLQDRKIDLSNDLLKETGWIDSDISK